VGGNQINVTAVCEPSGHEWLVTIPELPGAVTQVAHLNEVIPTVSSLVSRSSGISAADVRVTFRPTVYELLNPHEVYLPTPVGRWGAPGVTGKCRCGWATAPYWMSDNAGEAVRMAYDHVAESTGRQPRVGQTSNEELSIRATSAAFDPLAERPSAYVIRRPSWWF
jgi:hypothetical protein